MKLNSEEAIEVPLSTGQHMSPPPLARLKSGMGSIGVDMGNRDEIDYSPNKKSARPEPMSRIHLIPLLMIFVFFILWAGSTEIHSEGLSSEDSTPEILETSMRTPSKFGTTEQLKVSNDEIPQHGTRTVVDHDHAPQHKHASHHKHASRALSTNGLSEKTYIRGNTR